MSLIPDQRFSCIGSDVDFGGVLTAAIPCLAACASLVSILFEQRIWDPIFVTYDRIVSDIQAHFYCREGTVL